MKNLVLLIASLATLSACGAPSPSEDADVQNSEVIDGAAMVDAVSNSIDRQALENAARGAVEGAVRDALPMEELGAVGAFVDEEALAKGIDEAVDGQALGQAVRGAIRESEAPAAE